LKLGFISKNHVLIATLFVDCNLFGCYILKSRRKHATFLNFSEVLGCISFSPAFSTNFFSLNELRTKNHSRHILKAIVSGDDFMTQPSGASGEKIACGVIG